MASRARSFRMSIREMNLADDRSVVEARPPMEAEEDCYGKEDPFEAMNRFWLTENYLWFAELDYQVLDEYSPEGVALWEEHRLGTDYQIRERYYGVYEDEHFLADRAVC